MAEYQGKSMYVCVDLDKAHGRVPRKVLELAIRKKEISDVLDRSVMSLYVEAKRRGRVDSELSKKTEDKVGIHQGSVQSPFSSCDRCYR